MTDDLQQLRQRIDALDARIVELLNERAQVVIEVGKLKQRTGGSIYAPDREVALLRRLAEMNTGPLPQRTLEAVYRELMSGSFALEKPLRIAYVGPAGGFAHQAAVGKFGRSVDYVPLTDVASVFSEVQRGHADYGMVPADDAAGSLAETLDAFLAGAGGSVRLFAEVPTAVRHDLLAKESWADVKEVVARPEVLAQCREWLSSTARDRKVRPVATVAEAARTAGSVPGVAAIAPAISAELHGLKVLFEHIADDPDRVARFFVISKQAARKSNDDKTGVLFLTADKPGALADVLDAFRKVGVNLSDLEKRPTGTRRQHYAFYLDADANVADEPLTRALAEAEKHCLEMHILGSYPRAAEVV
ncbi:MAG: chorismate mutase [Planctomycetota bacterium]